MTSKTGVWAALCATALLAACSTSGERVLETMGTVSDVFSGSGLDRMDGEATVPAGFTPEAVAANPDNFRLFTINALGVAELARLNGVNGTKTTWISQSGFSASFDEGVLIATRGLVGEDVMAASAPGLRSALRAGGGTINRTMETLDSLNQIQTATFSCTISAAGTETINLGVREQAARRFDENCRGTSVIFDNIYWLDDRGEILASRQYVSPTVAYLRSNRL